MPAGSSLPSISATVIGPGRSQDGVTHLLSGPGLHPGVVPKDRERERGMERALEHNRDRRSSGAGRQESPGSARRERDQRERERERERERQIKEMKERERLERHAQREHERREEQRSREAQRDSQREQEDFRRHAHEMMGLSGLEREDREREWIKSQQMQAHGSQGLVHPNMRVQPQPQPQIQTMGPPPGEVWARFVPPRTGPPVDDGRMFREHEKEIERRRHEEMRMQELEWDAEKVERVERVERPSRTSKPRSAPKDREEKEQAKAIQKEERRVRASASQREKERKEREKAELEERERERERDKEREREREFRIRETQLARAKEAQFEAMEQERMHREMQDMEIIRAAARARESQGQLQGNPQHLHLHHHHHPYPPPSQSYPGQQVQAHQKSSSNKQGPMGTPGVNHPPPPGPGDVPSQFALERDPQFRQGPPPKGQMPSSLSQGVPVPQHQPPPPHLIGHHPIQHPHQMGPGPHMRQHPGDMYGPGGPLGYHTRRPSPPPFHPPSAPPAVASLVFPRSATPPPTLILPIRQLGTFVYPRIPFPFFDFPGPVSETGAPSDPIDIRATIYLPSRFLPLSRPSQPRIWGGGLIPAVPPLTGAQRQLVQQFSGGHPGYGRPEPLEIRDGRRVYTDDSDLFLCALHSGWVSWSMARRARREGKDLRLDLRLTREARYVGGLGAPLRFKTAETEADAEAEDDGSALLSSGWGNSHDGAGVEILKAEWVPSGTAHSFGLRNRSQRLLEYTERRCALGCAPRLGRKRRRLHAFPLMDVSESPLQLRLDRADDELSSTRVMVFGTDTSWPEIGFKYHPDAVKEVLFPHSTDSRPTKRRKLAASGDAFATEPITDASSDDGVSQQRAVVIETLWESFLISQRGQIPSGDGESDKENTVDGTDGGASTSHRYTIALLTNAGGTAGKLPRSTKAYQDNAASSAVDAVVPDGAAVKLNGAKASDNAQPTTGAADAKLADASAALTPVAPPGTGTGAVEEHAHTPAPSKASDDATDDGNGPIQILHSNLGEENFAFLPDGIQVLSSEVADGMRKGWMLEAQQWKWVQVGVSA
ncbi:hypothetical protein BD413DRAFT_615054 [Trametes elegans]|nr:hypothetical protein BD413DRAFT_615054 [Trametes elegans]